MLQPSAKYCNQIEYNFENGNSWDYLSLANELQVTAVSGGNLYV